MNKHIAMTEATKKALVDAFCDICKDKPVDKITVQEIARKAGCNRGTFYHHFKDVREMITHMEDIVISYVRDKIARNLLCDDIGEAFIKSLTTMHTDMEYYMKVLLCSSEGVGFEQCLKAEILPIYMERLSVSETDIKSIYILDFYFSGITAIAGRWFNEDRIIPIEELGLIISTMLTMTREALSTIRESKLSAGM